MSSGFIQTAQDENFRRNVMTPKRLHGFISRDADTHTAREAILHARFLMTEIAMCQCRILSEGQLFEILWLPDAPHSQAGLGAIAHVIGSQVGAAMIGAAALPAAFGLLAEASGLEAVPIGAAVLAGGVWGLHEVLVRRITQTK